MLAMVFMLFSQFAYSQSNYNLLASVITNHEQSLAQINRFDHWIEEEHKTEKIQFAEPDIFDDNSMICKILILRVHTILKIEGEKAYVHFYSGKMSEDNKPECHIEEEGQEYVLFLPLKPFQFDQRLKNPEFLEKRFPNLSLNIKENNLIMNVSDMLLSQDFIFKGDITFDLSAPIYANPVKMEGTDANGEKYLKTKLYEGVLTKPDISSIISLDQMPLCHQTENDFKCSDAADLNYLLN
jgi:hypothetical protein